MNRLLEKGEKSITKSHLPSIFAQVGVVVKSGCPVWKDGAPGPRRSIVHNTMEGVYAVRYGNWGFIDASIITLEFEPSNPDYS